jgi:two-component system, NtrC family, sensor histidine kinase HydH
VGDPALWRRLVVAALFSVMTLVVVSEGVRYRRSGLREVHFRRTVTVVVFGMFAMLLATGGIESPLAPGTPLFAILVGAVIENRAARIGLWSVQVLSVWVLAACAVAGFIPDLVPRFFGGGPRAGHIDALIWSQAAMLTLLFSSGYLMTASVRRGLDDLLRRVDEARSQALAAHNDRVHQLTTLSSEIAHELKNPLATVKGLAALLDEGQEGKNAERVAVLRREVDRMQATLEEFLNFSRPLGPLERSATDMRALCESVVRLHEGMALQATLRLDLRPSLPVPVHCDPRKVEQIVINLVQNAIEASSPGGLVELAIAARDGGAQIEVLDRGGGIDPAITGRIFEAGATTKAKGHGLGLTIARALAQQHGGELSLESREGGGCVARLSLPARAS